MAEEGSGGWSKCLGSCTHLGDQDEAPGSRILPGLTLALGVTWEVIQKIEDILSFFFFSSVSLSNKQIFKQKQKLFCFKQQQCFVSIQEQLAYMSITEATPGGGVALTT